MIAMTIAEIAAVVGGAATGPDDTLVTGPAFVDSRAAQPGGLFVAVLGEHVDGHDFAAGAVAAGAAAVLSSRPLGLPGVVVPDVVAALGRLAQRVASRLEGLTVIGITGSQGKTSTKDLLAQLLETAGETVAPVGSFNTEVGVPLTVLRADAATEFLVVEMGARGIGHIAYLADIVRPRVGVVLNVGVAHLAEFGSRAAIAEGKSELVQALPVDGVAVLNADDELVQRMRTKTSARVMSFGGGPAADVRFDEVRLDDDGRVRFRLGYRNDLREIALALVGRHHAANAAAAAAAALACGLTFDQVCSALGSASVRSAWRMALTTRADGVTVINDAYNANPDSMRAALETLAELGLARGDGVRTIAVLGEMRELGDTSREAHEAVGRLLAALGISQVVAVGESARAIASAAAQQESWHGRSVEVPDSAAAARYLQEEVRSGDVVLVKASRAAGLETLAGVLAADRAAAQ
jgi:UDP-N-acetylmuramoyl-tripeptide--D-alanyl-D-alanine ligase